MPSPGKLSRIAASGCSPGLMGLGEAGDPLGGGAEGDPVAGLTGPDAEPGGEVGLAGAGRLRKMTFSFPATKFSVPQMGDDLQTHDTRSVSCELIARERLMLQLAHRVAQILKPPSAQSAP